MFFVFKFHQLCQSFGTLAKFLSPPLLFFSVRLDALLDIPLRRHAIDLAELPRKIGARTYPALACQAIITVLQEFRVFRKLPCNIPDAKFIEVGPEIHTLADIDIG